MWAVVALTHLAGNPFYGKVWPEPTAVGLALAAVGVTATVTLIRPSVSALLVLCALIPLSAALETPLLGNHWCLAAGASLAYLAAVGRWERFAPAGRWTVVIFYAFAAFAKLNTGFFDPAVSCANFYANQMLGAAGLPTFDPSGLVGRLAVVATVVIEASIPLLVVFGRTRRLGVLLVVAFHGLLSFDFAQHFFDFTSVLLALHLLFLDDAGEVAHAAGARVGEGGRTLAAALITALGLGVTWANVTPLSSATVWFLRTFTFFWWTPYLVVIAWIAWRARPAEAIGRLSHWATAVVVALVFVNGLTPYLEIKTAFSYNMYANLVTAQGWSNHLIVRATLPLRDGYDDPVQIVASNDQRLRAYAREGWLIAWPSFRSFLAENPNVAVIYRRREETIALRQAADDPDLVAPVPWWWRYLPLRAIDTRDPPRCQPSFLRAL